jgi:hypothetical protein
LQCETEITIITEGTEVRKRSLAVGLGFICNTDMGFYFMTLGFLPTAKKKKNSPSKVVVV